MKPLTLIVVLALIAVVAIGIFLRFRPPGDGSIEVGDQANVTPTPVPPKEPMNITILAALPVEPWVTSAAEVYNAEERYVGDRPVNVTRHIHRNQIFQLSL